MELRLESAPQGRRRLQSFFPKSVREDDLYFFVCFLSFLCFFSQIFQIFVFSDFSISKSKHSFFLSVDQSTQSTAKRGKFSGGGGNFWGRRLGDFF